MARLTTPPWLTARTPVHPPNQDLLLPSGILAESFPRKSYDGDTRVATSGTLWLASIVLPGGEPLTKVNAYVSGDATTQTLAVAHIISPVTDLVLAVSADKTSTEPGTGPDPFVFPEFEVDEDGAYYVGLLYIAGTGPTLRSFNSSSSFWGTDLSGSIVAGGTAGTTHTEALEVGDDIGTITTIAELIYVTAES